MFDYQAGEKYKLTLTMAVFAGLMAGTLFTLVLMPQPDVRPHKPPRGVNWSTTAQATGAGCHSGCPRRLSQKHTAIPDPIVTIVSAVEAQNLVQAWLPLAWDLSAGSARGSQEKAIVYMTPDCAAAYKQNVWTPEVAKTIEDAGLKSTLTLEKITPGQAQSDGSIVIFVEGTQNMSVPGKGTQLKPKRLEYLIKSTQEGLRVAGISESGQQS